MKILGVDYGEARTGLAYSDALGLYAVGMGNIKSYDMEKTALEIAVKAKEIGAQTIVIGKPVNMNGTLGEKVEKVENFKPVLRFIACSDVHLSEEENGLKNAEKFRKVFGCSIKDYIIEQRITAAKSMLINENLSSSKKYADK